MKAQMDLKRIFLCAPRALWERAVLFAMLVVSFMVFFRPLQFSQMSPLEAFMTAALPALSISWGWLVLLRSLFSKAQFMKK